MKCFGFFEIRRRFLVTIGRKRHFRHSEGQIMHEQGVTGARVTFLWIGLVPRLGLVLGLLLCYNKKKHLSVSVSARLRVFLI